MKNTHKFYKWQWQQQSQEMNLGKKRFNTLNRVYGHYIDRNFMFATSNVKEVFVAMELWTMSDIKPIKFFKDLIA